MSKRYDTPATNTWCPGCGNFTILNVVKQTFDEMNIDPWEAVAVTGIGCHGKLTDYIGVNGIHTIHGRVLPVSSAIKLANHELKVLGFAGDGDAFNIGIGHFAHAVRRNVDLTYIIHNNLIYGLTTGQTSPTSTKGYVSKTSPRGSWEKAINPLTQALTAGATFVSRAYVGEFSHFKDVLKQAINHEGFALVDVLQPCISWNKVNTYEFYRNRVFKLEETGHNSEDWDLAYLRAEQWGDQIPIGVFYKSDEPPYRENFPALKKGMLVNQPLRRDMEKLFREFM
ncbi:2-oxoacid:ferredoxin oxidoreductase subunit beta [Candidatus Bathyarchaeota archaeon]|nr:2-oxoacid:ferredoxin oxidoreductase subunit beta [Candidatus Bathyarchaeota archaeon]